MAFDPSQEEFRRLGLRFARAQDVTDSFAAARAASAFRRRFAWNHDSLPQNDQDRAFHLVVRASQIVDGDLPFADEKDCAALIFEARQLLVEAVGLDEGCYDARRMIATQDCTSFEEFYRYLVDGLDEVREGSRHRHDKALASGLPGCNAEASLMLRPLMRWLAALSARALISGRYTRSLDYARELLEMDPSDPADVRFTAALALAKLEDNEGMARLLEFTAKHVPFRRRPDAWTLLSLAALALRRDDEDECTGLLHRILDTYPRAGSVLMAQGEVPDGVFARLDVEPYSNDELVLAVSEGTVLLQEGQDMAGLGSFGAFVASDPFIQAANEREQEAAAAAEDTVMGQA